jgi:hypothetical protein
MKICSKCKIEKELNIDNYRICKYPNGKEYFKATCRECERLAVIKYNSKHKEERKEYNKDFYKNNPDYLKNWKNDNRDKINTQYRERLANDPEFKLRKNCSRAISRMLKINNSSKFNHSILQYLPYSIEQLKLHIEKQFNDRMGWDNYGIYWEIDHIIPQSCLPYKTMEDDNFKKCWSLENLRPYQIDLNRSEGAMKIRHKIINNNAII